MAKTASGSSKAGEDPLPGELERYGISRVSIDQFEVGGYRYSNLQDAIAEARRREQKGASA